MTVNEWGLLYPEMVSEWINFNRDQKDWHYTKGERQSMPAKQTEGVAYLWNLLAEKRVALLADEVGMGKTFQALGVAALLWKMKPDARVLVMAPNRDLCLHWRREFTALVRTHYRAADHTVKNSIDGGPVPSIEFCKSLADLDAAVNRGVSHLYLTTIHTLSGLLNRSDKGQGKPEELAAKIAQEIHKSIKSALGPGGFDLVIVDEAHYFRNIHGGSQRVAAAKAFFGTLESPLSQRTLLLTATPSHTRLSDVASIFSYCLPLDDLPTEGERASYLLNTYGLRRMRLMEGGKKLFSKRHYRHEKNMPATFERQPEAEGFFALYQKGLVAELNKKNDTKSLMYGYLEGFESVGRDRTRKSLVKSQGEEDNGESGRAGDYSSAHDTNLLMGLTDSYYSAFGRFPEHPKYGRMIEACIPSSEDLFSAPLNDLKHLIFVRRIPSVRELTQRLNERYDALLGEMLFSAWGEPFNDQDGLPRLKDLTRVEFQKFVESHGDENTQDQSDDVEPDAGDASDEDEDYLASRIAQLFVVKKGAGGQTDCANVRLRFTKPENLFSLFLEPASDYLTGGYTCFYSDSERKRANYTTAARYERFLGWNRPSDLREVVGDRAAPETPYVEKLYTYWSLVLNELPTELQEKLHGWAKHRKAVAENFANYLKAGFLHASPVIVELYGWFVEYRRKGKNTNVQEWYRGFFEFVRDEKIKGSLLLRYFAAALQTFEALCGKIVDHGVEDWRREWASLKSLSSPAWFASGENNSSRQRLILGFNSPFYPNVLVSTSVLQEGVNLHLNCHQVHHYGISGSPGANEQRVGRVDRLFGCVNKRLEAGAGDLSIVFPYLESSVDEDQVASFIARKYQVEERMDACLQTKFDSEFRAISNADWVQFLRKPLLHTNEPVEDPYPAKFEFQGEAVNLYEAQLTHTFEDVVRTLRHHLKSVCDPLRDQVIEAKSTQVSPKPLFIIDPLLERGDSLRHQPVFATLGFSPQFSALVPETAYIFSFASPIVNGDDFKEICVDELQKHIEELSALYPLVRVAIDECATNSHFYLSARVNFPLFVRQGKLLWLSSHEIKMGLESIKRFSDELEARLVKGQDLTLQEVDAKKISGPVPLVEPLPKHKVNVARKAAWNKVETVLGGIDQIQSPLPQDPLCSAPKEGGEPRNDLNSLKLNHRFPFINFVTRDTGTHAQLSYPSDDFQDGERELLEEWFYYVVSSY